MNETLRQKCVEILTAMLQREPNETELGNVMTDSNIVAQATAELLVAQASPPS